MSSAFFRIEMLPARHGDALWVEYGTAQRTRRMLIDGGPLGAYAALDGRLRRLPAGDQRVELVVVSHVDTDHIEGLIRLMAEPETRWPIAPEEIWFNGWRHVEEASTLGGREGEFLSALIHRRADQIWNRSFAGKAVRTGALVGNAVDLADGMRLTLVSPDAEALAKLRKDWEKNVDRWGLDPGDLDAAWEQLTEENKFHPEAELTLGPDDRAQELLAQLKGRDPSAANGSSIAFLAEFGGKSCLFLADAHANVVCESLKELGYSEANPLRVDALKLSHHGSDNNVTGELLGLVDAEHYLVSSNGDIHGHPDEAAIELVTLRSRRPPVLWFNYRSPYNAVWEQRAQAQGARFGVRYPPPGESGITLSL